MKKVFRIEELDCANCAAKMENGIKKIEGIVNAAVSFMTKRLTVEFAEDYDIDSLMKSVVSVCKKVEPDCSIKEY